jgi:hypothetical protein
MAYLPSGCNILLWMCRAPQYQACRVRVKLKRRLIPCRSLPRWEWHPSFSSFGMVKSWIQNRVPRRVFRFLFSQHRYVVKFDARDTQGRQQRKHTQDMSCSRKERCHAVSIRTGVRILRRQNHSSDCLRWRILFS